MDRTSAVDCLAIPVAGAVEFYPKPEAVLFGLIYGMAIGKGHPELADALMEAGVAILLGYEGTPNTPERQALFHDYMNDIIEVMAVTLV